tara:strand:- start:110793 stop:111200 length:408 start_codon:yes stop_codon:yes gene_type:complete
MVWVIRILFLGIVIGIARKYPKISILIAIILFLFYVNSNSDYSREKRTENIEAIQNPSNSNRIYANPENAYKPNTLDNRNNSDYSYKPSIKIVPETKTSTRKVRVGAVCRDGSTSKATGRGACSHHGGVAYWLYE